MEQNKSSIAIVILSWNDPKNTFELIKSIFENDYQNFDIFLVDNNSDKMNFDILINLIEIEKFDYQIIYEYRKFIKEISPKKKINIIRSTEISDIKFAKNVGVAKGYNKGIELALRYDYDYLMKLDCDFIIDQKLISGLINTFEKNDDCVAISPKVYYFKDGKKTNVIWWKGVNFTKNYFRFQRTGKGGSRKVEDVGQFTGVQKSEGICGCCVMFKTSVLAKTGNLDKDFFFGPEDIEHAFRLKKFGSILINLDLIAYHKVSQSIFVSGIESRIYFETIGWLLLIKKICNTRDKYTGYVFFLLRGFLHGFRLVYKSDRKPHLGYLQGLRDFFLKY